MKYFVISTRKDETFMPMTVCAELNDSELAHRLMNYWNRVDKGQMTEIHPVMNDEDVIDFLNKWDNKGL